MAAKALLKKLSDDGGKVPANFWTDLRMCTGTPCNARLSRLYKLAVANEPFNTSRVMSPSKNQLSVLFLSLRVKKAAALFKETLMNSIIYLVGLVVVVLFVLSLLGLR